MPTFLHVASSPSMGNRLTYSWRFLSIAILFLALLGVSILAGTMTSNPAMNSFPDNDDVGPNPNQYTNQQVSLGGEVIATDPVVIRVEYGLDNHFDLVLTHLDTSVEEGQHGSAFGTLTDANTLDTERALVRWPWEEYSMYALSILAAIWVAARIYRHLRFDRHQLAFTPRGDSDA